MKKVAIACDRAGIELKDFLIQEMADELEFVNLGTNTNDPVDYPDFAKKVVKERYDWIKNFKTQKQYRIFIARAHVSQLKLTNGDLLVYDYICENKKFVNCAVL